MTVAMPVTVRVIVPVSATPLPVLAPGGRTPRATVSVIVAVFMVVVLPVRVFLAGVPLPLFHETPIASRTDRGSEAHGRNNFKGCNGDDYR
ncbi:hypothetical protein [Streptomyces sp. URMC 123]|uniref:hypothetical protein n=1 Tax=Streptomyces sp. URMC 123 TaxID=3423403 RepID=UPI003F19FECB